MAESSILKTHSDWNKIIDLKIKHIETLTDFGKQIFFAIFGLFFAIIIALISIASSIILNTTIWGFLGILIGLFVLFWFLSGKLAIGVSDNIKEYYNRLFYEILVGKINNIKPLSEEEYDKMTTHLK